MISHIEDVNSILSINLQSELREVIVKSSSEINDILGPEFNGSCTKLLTRLYEINEGHY